MCTKSVEVFVRFFSFHFSTRDIRARENAIYKSALETNEFTRKHLHLALTTKHCLQPLLIACFFLVIASCEIA